MSELQLLRWQLLDLLWCIIWEAVSPPWQEFQEKEDEEVPEL